MKPILTKLKKDKRGSLVAGILMVTSIAAFAIFLLIIGYIGNTVGTELKNQINSTNEDVNAAFDRTIITSTTTLSTLWYIMFGCLMLGVFISAWFVRDYPILIPVYLILLVVSVIVGAAMSNAYEELTLNASLATAAAQQSAIRFIMLNLPYVALTIGLIALAISFAKPDSIGGGGGVIG